MSKARENWVKRSEVFSRIRAQIKKVLAPFPRGLDYAEIAHNFKYRFSYLPNIERRLAELVKSGEVVRIPGKISKYRLKV